ncbi:MAG: hypothetical protein H6867_11135 [Rhodospirillales bacterium]|nr:hypothetical protein [Rhodospirillales bacterium]MCB9996683.1 hypothetical protein [Rhodospirillales bacterium]
MTGSHITNVKPTAIFNLNALLLAVQADKAIYEEQVNKAPAWAKSSQPSAMFNALNGIEKTLTEWQASGVTQVTSDAPFSDGNITGDVNDTIVMQFKDKRVKPVLPTNG